MQYDEPSDDLRLMNGPCVCYYIGGTSYDLFSRQFAWGVLARLRTCKDLRRGRRWCFMSWCSIAMQFISICGTATAPCTEFRQIFVETGAQADSHVSTWRR